jgi:hypothetical protein
MPTQDERQDDQLAALNAIADAFDRGDFEYMVTGSVSLGLQGEPRFTNDMDVIVEVSPERVAGLIAVLEQDFDVQPEMVESEVKRGGMFNVFHSATVFKVDLIVLGSDPLSRAQFARRQRIQREGRTYSVISAEDLILAKLSWARESHSEMQLRDVWSLLRTRQDLDLSYIEGWIKRLELGDLWDEARKS